MSYHHAHKPRMHPALVLVALALSVAAPAQTVRIDKDKLDAYVARSIGDWLRTENIPGATFAFVAGGQVVLARGYGMADIAREVPVDPERTLFRVASLSKSFAATAIAQLVEQGKVAFDDEIDRYLPELATTRHPLGAITLHDLLTHSAGYDDRNIGRMVRTLGAAPPLAPFVVSYQPSRVYAVGDLCSYSNYGYFALGHVVEQVSGQTFADYVQQQILTPLGMHHSSFAPSAERMRDFALGYIEHGDVRWVVDHGWDIGGAASSLSTTAADYGRYLLAHLNGGELDGARVLLSAGIANLHARQFRQHPRLDGVCYGWFERSRRGWRRLEHGGHWSGFSSRVVIVPELGIGAFVSMNAEWAGWPVQVMLDRLFDEILPAREPKVAELATADSITPGHAYEVAGAYRTTQRARSDIEAITTLFRYGEVVALDEGRLRYRYTDYVEVAPYVFLPAAQQRYQMQASPIVFDRADDGTMRLLSGHLSSEQVAWFDTHLWQAIVVSACALVACLSLVLGVIALARRRATRAHRIVGLLGAHFVVVAVGLHFSVDYALGSNGGEFGFGVPWWTVVLLTLPLIALGLTVWLAIDLVAMWRRGRNGLLLRVWLTFAWVGHAGFLVWLHHWNLLGYHF